VTHGRYDQWRGGLDSTSFISHMSALPNSPSPATDSVPHPLGAVLPTDCASVAVLVEPTQRRLIAVQAIPAGSFVCRIEGHETSVPSHYSLQVGRDRHLDPDDAHDPMDRVRRRFWRYLNHHCEPNAVIRDFALLAIRDIAPGEGVTFDYNTTEWDLADPFACHCGSPACVGVVRGARHLTAAQRERLEPYLSAYLR
jgi:hypothetical protein